MTLATAVIQAVNERFRAAGRAIEGQSPPPQIKPLTLRACLFDSTINAAIYDPQAPRQIWAIVEGILRLSVVKHDWRTIGSARKAHTCMKGCEINPGDTYFTHSSYSGWAGDAWKCCAGCAAMIAYFNEVWEMDCGDYDFWPEQL